MHWHLLNTLPAWPSKPVLRYTLISQRLVYHTHLAAVYRYFMWARVLLYWAGDCGGSGKRVLVSLIFTSLSSRALLQQDILDTLNF
jgi:hypothetical protein